MREPIAPRRRAHRMRLLGIALLTAAGVSLAAVAPAMAATPSPTPTPTNTVVQSATITAVPQCTVDPALGCVAGTLNDGNGNGVKGVTISMSDAGSDAASTVTSAEGHFAFKVSQNGLYTLTLKTSTLPNGVKATVTRAQGAGRRRRAPRRVLPADRFVQGVEGDHQHRPDHVHRHRGPARRAGAAARPAARARLDRPLADLRHDRAVELRARGAGDPRRLHGLQLRHRARPALHPRRARRGRRSAPPPATSRTA